MRDIAEVIRRLGGMVQKRQLVRLGAHDRQLTAVVRSGDVVRVRNGWYSTLSEDAEQLRAVRVGGRLTGISALIASGAWVLGTHPLHVSVPVNSSRLRAQWNRHQRINVGATRGVVLHWDAPAVSEHGSVMQVGLLDALERVVLDEDLETAVAVLDWALHTGVLDGIDFESLILRLPAERRGIAGWVDAECESLPESLARTRLRLSGHSVVTQVPIEGTPMSVDLVVDDVVGIEVDGDKFHRERFEYDRSKDVDITLMELHALRPSARMVFGDWPRFERAVDVALSLHVAAVVANSGIRRRDPYRIRGMTGWRRRPPRRLPEFSTGLGNSAPDAWR
jgi:hypothetical protein